MSAGLLLALALALAPTPGDPSTPSAGAERRSRGATSTATSTATPTSTSIPTAIPSPSPSPPPTPLPQGTARWRMSLGGEPVGVVELSIRCEGPACQATWTSRQRLPAEAGGGFRERRVTAPVDRQGRAAGPVRWHEAGRSGEVSLPAGAAPAMLVEVLLSRGAPRCLDAADEATGAPLRACAVEAGPGERRLTGGAAEVRLRPGPGPFPAEVSLPAQRVRFTLDPAAEVPPVPPRLFGAEVTGPADPRDAARFCGLPPDPPAPPDAGAGLPRAEAAGASCREQALAWAEAARRDGLASRVAVGVAHDGGAFLWHAWAEARVGGRWVAVDPAFRQAPARGPRFTVATWAPGDEAARAEAGRRLLACWGRGGVEPARP